MFMGKRVTNIGMDSRTGLSIKVKGTSISAELKQSIVSLFHQIDMHATGETYHSSSADISREILNLDDSVPDTEALESFIDHYTSTYILGFIDSTLIGFALIKENDSSFKNFFSDSYPPLVALHFVGIHPEYQNQGLAHQLLLYIRRLYTNTLGFSYLVAGAASENTASQNALESIGMRRHNATSSVGGDDETVIYKYKLQK